MEPEKKPRKVRFISGRPELVDAQVNEMLGEYAIASINFATTSEGVIVTCYLILASEVRMMQIAQGVANGGQRR
jgi:hypothetical protein